MDKINVSAKAIGINGAQFKLNYKGATLFRARQDTALIGLFDKFILTGIFDGHGVSGDFASITTAKYFWDYFKEQHLYLIELLQQKNYQLGKELIKQAFKTINSKVEQGGTTATLNIVLEVDNQKILINANVGDSPMFEISDQVKAIYQDQSADNLAAYQLYVDHQVKVGQPILEPVLSICRTLRAPPNYKEEWPPKLFQLDDQKKVSIRENSKEILTQILEYNFGPHYPEEYVNYLTLGTQTIRTNRDTHPMQNFGSHLSYQGTQMVSGIGDHDVSICLPFVEIKDLKPETKTLVLFSDGIDDFIEDYNDLIALTQSSTTANDLWKQMITYIDLKCTDPKSKHYQDKAFKTQDYFKHDDCSIVLMHFD